MQRRAEFLDIVTHPSSTIGDAVTGRIVQPVRTRDARQHLASYGDLLEMLRLPWSQRLDQAAIMERQITAGFKGVPTVTVPAIVRDAMGACVRRAAVVARGL